MVGLREIFGAAGALGGIMAGWILGGLLGAILGGIVAANLIDAPFEIYDEWRRRQKRAQLRPFFGEYHARDKADEWKQTKARLKPGEVVKGVVVHAGRSFVFVDIGCEFPAILSSAPEPSERKKRALLEPGSEIEAQVMGFSLEREIEITQSGRWLLLDGEMVGFIAYAEWPIEGRYYLRYAQNTAYAAFLKLPKSELTSRCEVLTGDETQRVSVKRNSFSPYVYVEISLLEGAPSPP